MNTKIDLEKFLPDTEELLKIFYNDISGVQINGLPELLKLPVVAGYNRNDNRYVYDASYVAGVVNKDLKDAEVIVEDAGKVLTEAVTVVEDVAKVVDVVKPLL